LLSTRTRRSAAIVSAQPRVTPRPRPSPTDRALSEYVLVMRLIYVMRGPQDRAEGKS